MEHLCSLRQLPWLMLNVSHFLATNCLHQRCATSAHHDYPSTLQGALQDNHLLANLHASTILSGGHLGKNLNRYACKVQAVNLLPYVLWSGRHGGEHPTDWETPNTKPECSGNKKKKIVLHQRRQQAYLYPDLPYTKNIGQSSLNV